jgi:hypothetical protein
MSLRAWSKRPRRRLQAGRRRRIQFQRAPAKPRRGRPATRQHATRPQITTIDVPDSRLQT